MHARQQIPDLEAELGIERQRPVVVGGLHQPDSRRGPVGDPAQNILHECSADPTVLHPGVNGDWANTNDGRPLVKEVAADDAPVDLGHNGVEARMTQEHRQQADPRLQVREVGSKLMRPSDRLKRLVADTAADLGVLGCT